jgi:hypothetical protein
MKWLFESVGGRKFLLGVLGIVAVTVLAGLHEIPGEAAVEAIKWMVIGVAGAVAVEDGLSAMGTSKKSNKER